MNAAPARPRIAPLGRWRPAVRGAAGAMSAGWRAWAAALAGRHALLWRAVAGAGMSLRRQRLAGEVRERRLAPAIQLFPTVRLSIGPFLRQEFWRAGAPAMLPARAAGGPDDPVATVALGATAPAPSAAAGRRGGRRPLGPLGRRGSAAAPAAVPEVPAGRRLQVVPAAPVAGPVPVERVLRRLREGPHGGNGPLAWPAGSAPAAAASTPTALARDLAARRVRLEALPAAAAAGRSIPAVLRRDPAAAGSGQRAGEAPWEDAAPSWASGAGGWGGGWDGRRPRPAAPPAAPPPAALAVPNVEALADRVMQQIDRRLSAWRERTGAF